MRMFKGLAICLLLGNLAGQAQEQPKPETTVDLKPLGAAADLFSKTSEDRTELRALLNLFWLGQERIVAAFNVSPRFAKSEKPVPFQVRLVVFDLTGKQVATRDWSFPSVGPEADSMLAFEAGPERTILAIHSSSSDAPGLPEGNLIQVFSQEAKLLQDFYIPSNSVMIPSSPDGSSLVLQQFLGTGRSVLHYFSGRPLKNHLDLRLSRQTQTLAGPMEAAQQLCATNGSCPGIQIVRTDGSTWTFSGGDMPSLYPRAFLNPSTLLVEAGGQDQPTRLLLLHADTSRTELPVLNKGDNIADIAGASDKGDKFAMDTYGSSGMCGFLDFTCSHHARSVVVSSAGKVIFEQPFSTPVGRSALSPDGRHVALLDHGKLLLFSLP